LERLNKRRSVTKHINRTARAKLGENQKKNCQQERKQKGKAEP